VGRGFSFGGIEFGPGSDLISGICSNMVSDLGPVPRTDSSLLWLH
jgi:hypothetical protein